MQEEKKEDSQLYAQVSVQKLDTSEVEVSGEIPVASYEPYRSKALKKLGEHIKIDGFRPGHIPEKILIEKIGEDGVMGEIAELALADAYPALITEHELDVIGQPQVMITKLAAGNPIGFKIKSAVVPTFDLPNYTEIAKEVMKGDDDLEVTDGDVERVLMEVRRGKAQFEKAQKTQQESQQKTDTEKNEDTSADKGGTKEEKEEDLPELDDAFIQTIGNFKTVEEFKKRVREDLAKEKAQKAREKKRVALSEKIIEQTDISLPQILVTSELDKMMAQMRDDVARVNMKFEDYLSQIKKTEEDLRDEWKEQAEKRAKLQLILNNIARKEGIKADHDEVHRQMDMILERFKDAKPENVHVYVETQLTNEEVFSFLEKQGESKKVEK